MEKKNNKYTALLNVMKRELRRLVSRPLYLFCMVIAPLFCYIFFTTLMDSGLPTDMPVGVVDRDMTATSRQLVRNLDAFEQTANTLAQIDAVLEKQGSSRSRILDATIFLADGADFAAMNQAWDAWVVAGHAPVRCTVQATLMDPQYKVEIKIIAAV